MGEWSGSDGITTSLRAAGCMFAGTKLSSTNLSASLHHLPTLGRGRPARLVDTMSNRKPFAEIAAVTYRGG
jgi:hypothetical protein